MPKPSAGAEAGGAAVRLTPQQTVERLVEAAATLLAEKGPSEIKARSVAEAAQVSTMAVYYHLGGLPEHLQAVVDKGFRDLDRAFDAVTPSEDPVVDLFAMALATRQLAQHNPHLYDLMFGLSTRGSYRPLQTSSAGASGRSQAFQAAYTHLVQACARLVHSGRIRTDENPEIVAGQPGAASMDSSAGIGRSFRAVQGSRSPGLGNNDGESAGRLGRQCRVVSRLSRRRDRCVATNFHETTKTEAGEGKRSSRVSES